MLLSIFLKDDLDRPKYMNVIIVSSLFHPFPVSLYHRVYTMTCLYVYILLMVN